MLKGNRQIRMDLVGTNGDVNLDMAYVECGLGDLITFALASTSSYPLQNFWICHR